MSSNAPSLACGESQEIVEVMKQQETYSAYKVHHYLLKVPPPSTHLLGYPSAHLPIDGTCRKLMVDWCGGVVKFCEYSHETTAIAISCLDRFVCTTNGGRVLLDPNGYQLAAITSLYLASKIHESQPLDLASISKLVQDKFSRQDVETMERRILREIKWRVNPPTPMAFVSATVGAIEPILLDVDDRDTILELSNFQIALALGDYDLSLNKPSLVAYASLLNAIDCLDEKGSRLRSRHKYLESVVSCILEAEKDDVENIRFCLLDLTASQSAEDSKDLIELLRRRTCWSEHRDSMLNTKVDGPVSPRGVVGSFSPPRRMKSL